MAVFFWAPWLQAKDLCGPPLHTISTKLAEAFLMVWGGKSSNSCRARAAEEAHQLWLGR